MKRVGVFGGTFDPIHYGHLVTAEECRARLELDYVLFVPTGQPPHKQRRVVSPADARVNMVQLAIASNPAFQLSRIEVDYPGPSYSVETVARLQQQFGPEVELYFIIGMDSLNDLLTWREPARLVSLCRIVAATRPGAPPPDFTSLESVIPHIRERVTILPVPELNISSSELRRRVSVGLPIKYQLPESVEAYVYGHHLYEAPQVTRRGS